MQITLPASMLRRALRAPHRRQHIRPIHTSPALLAPRSRHATIPTSTPSALSALLSRLSLPSSTALHPALIACLTHPSFAQSSSSADPSSSTSSSSSSEPPTSDIETNELLASLGNSLLGLFASEHHAQQYPLLPTEALKLAVTSFVGPKACFSVARELGLGLNGPDHPTGGISVRFHRSDTTAREEQEAEIEGLPIAGRFKKYIPRPEDPGRRRSDRQDSFEDVVASAVRAFVGLIYQEKGLHSAREFVEAFFLSRHLDMTTLFHFRNPKHVLSSVVGKHLAEAGVPLSSGAGRLESRVLASTGVNSQSPLFNIGIFLPSGLKLAEGHGSSLAMAEHRAAVNALHSLFLVRGDQGHRLPGLLGQSTSSSASQASRLPSSVHATRPIQDGGVAGSEDEAVFAGVAWGGSEGIVETSRKAWPR